jgi:parvulin-like peptidyl-prolyl isomerase
MMRKNAPGLLICSIGLLSAWGCAAERVRPLSSALFSPVDRDVPAEAPSDSAAKVASDQQPAADGGDLPKKAAVLPAAEPSIPFADIKPIDPLTSGPTTNPASVMQNTDSAPVAAPASALIPADTVAVPTASGDAQPAVPTATASAGQGVYMTLGGVVAIVNDTPIFANEVLEPLNREFAIKAREMEEKDFRQFAMKEIGRQAEELIQDEVYFAQAYHALNDDDKKLAQYIAVENRMLRVTAAGGSVEQARRKAMEDGEDFDETLKKEYRLTVINLYRQRHIEPLVQITADGMRDYYRLNADKRYSDKDKAQFRVIEIDPQAAGGMQAAMDKINAIREKAIRGADFAELASKDNDDPEFKAHGGNPLNTGEWMPRNEYANEALEAAIWQLQPGQITPVVKNNNLLYIAKLEARHDGRVRPFEDPAVQDDIYKNLRQSQLAMRMQAAREEEFDASMVDTNDERMQVALDMAMQRYAQSSAR